MDQHAGTTEIWLFDLARGAESRLTFDPRTDWTPVWSPDGRRIAFAQDEGGAAPHLHVKGVGDTGSAVRLLPPTGWVQFVHDWAEGPEGEFILYQDGTPQTASDLMILPLRGDRTPRRFLRTPFDEADGRVSPDAKWVAYASNESGRSEVYVRPLEGSGDRWQISTAGGMMAVCSSGWRWSC